MSNKQGKSLTTKKPTSRWHPETLKRKVPERMSDREREFFGTLAKLCEEYGASINGCGCCGSPSVTFKEEHPIPDRCTCGDGRLVRCRLHPGVQPDEEYAKPTTETHSFDRVCVNDEGVVSCE